MFLLDGLVVAGGFFASFYLRQKIPILYRMDLFPKKEILSEPSSSIDSYLVLLFLAVPLWCLALYLNGMYKPLRTRKMFEVVWTIVKSALFVLVGFGAIIFFMKWKFVSRLFFIIFILVSFLFLLGEKIALFLIMHQIRRRGHNIQRILVVGKGKRASGMIQSINRHSEWGLQIIGVIDDEPGKGPEKVEGVRFVGGLTDLGSVLKNGAVDEVIFVVPRSRLNFIEQAVRECEIVGVKATVAIDLFDLKIAKWRHRELDGIPFVSFETTVANETQLFLKRGLDLFFSTIGIIVGLPIFLMIGLSIKLTSRGPVLFKQVRAGLNGRHFVLYKFRTMFTGADQQRAEIEEFNEMDGPVFKIKSDPRITPFGKILRKFSLDELPQLFNVFAGQMSIIGPRALPIYEVEKIEPWQRRRLSMRPGLTCLWQVCGRNKVDFKKWMELDLEYLDNWSLWLDFKILARTIPVVLFGIGAY